MFPAQALRRILTRLPRRAPAVRALSTSSQGFSEDSYEDPGHAPTARHVVDHIVSAVETDRESGANRSHILAVLGT